MKIFHLNEIWDVLVHQSGCKSWTGGEETCIDGLAPGINYGTKTGLVKELYQGRECVHMLSAIGKII